MFRLLSAGLLGLTLAATAALAADEDGFTTLYAGPQDAGNWITSTGRAVPGENMTAEGLNPHRSGGYLVVYKEPMKGDYVLDFDYQLSPGCNSGVFVRVGDLADPVMTGLEIALDDTKGSGLHDSGAIYDLVPPSTNAQKPAGQWNHMTITVQGPVVTVALNGQEVSRIDQAEWTVGGQRPDGSRHKFGNIAIRDLAQDGYFGFQDHGSKALFKNIKVKRLDSQ